MNDDDMKKLWRQHELVPPLQVTDIELINRMKNKMKQFDRDVLNRDWRELIACAIVFGAFFYFSLHLPSALARVGCVVIMLGSIFIGWKLVAARREHPPVSETASTSDFLRAEIAKVDRQTRLLQTVLWWYLLPLFIGVELFMIGISRARNLGELLLSNVIIGAVFGFVYWVNLYAVRKSLLPLKQELEHALDPENVPAPEIKYHPGGPQLRIKLGRRTFEFPQECPMLLRFCIALNAFWVLLPCSMLQSADIPGETYPGIFALAIVLVVSVLAWISADRDIPKSRLSRTKLLLLAFAGFTGLFALAWGIKMFRVLLT